MRGRAISITRAGLALACWLAVAPGHAQLDARLSYSAAVGCPAREDFEQRLRARMRSGAGGSATLTVRLSAPGHASLRISEGEKLVGERSLTAASCSEAADALAFVAALLLDEHARNAAAQHPRRASRAAPPTASGRGAREARGAAARERAEQAATAREAAARDAREREAAEAAARDARQRDDAREAGEREAAARDDALEVRDGETGGRDTETGERQTVERGSGLDVSEQDASGPGARGAASAGDIDAEGRERDAAKVREAEARSEREAREREARARAALASAGRAPLDVWLAAGASIATGVAPKPRPGLDLEAGFAIQRSVVFAAAVGARAVLPQDVRSLQGDARLRWASASLALCAGPHLRAVHLLGCLDAELGRIHGEGRATDAPRERNSAWYAVGPGLRARVPVWRRLSLTASAALPVPLTRDRFVVGAAELHRVPSITFRASLGLALEFE